MEHSTHLYQKIDNVLFFGTHLLKTGYIVVDHFTTDLMTIDILPKLKEIEAQLSAQEDDLTAQLSSLKEKLSSIRSVLTMFSQDSDGAEGAQEEASDVSAVATQPEKKEAAKGKAAASSKRTTAKKKTSSRKGKKKDGRAAAWQKYTRPGVKNDSIPDAVKIILSTQPEKEFKIAEVMDALFQEKMPKVQYNKARNRVSNVLSGGARAGDWHKGTRGTYRLSAA